MLTSTKTQAERPIRGVRPQIRLALSVAALTVLGALVGAALFGCGQASIPIPSCGTVAIDHLRRVIDTQAEQAETCFYQGFQDCRTVSLGLSQLSGVDTATESIFSVRADNRGSCYIAETNYDIINTSVTAGTTVTCTAVSRQNNGLVISSCSSGPDVFIPAPAAPTSTQVQSPSPTS